MRDYGKLTFVGGRWVIEAEPHIMLRLRRVFERVSKSEFGFVSLSDTPETARDIAWFTDRYPLSMAADVRTRLDEGAGRHRDNVLRLEGILAGNYRAKVCRMALPPREYQQRASEVLLAQKYLLLGDELGLGKTVTALAALSDPRLRPAVVVCYPFLQPQWVAELRRFTPELRPHVIQRGTPYALPRLGGGPDVIFMTYQKLAGWAESLKGYARSIVFDEVQELRHARTGKYNAARHLASGCEYKLGMSGTPVYNLGGEVFNIMEVLAPGVLGTPEEFVREWGYYDKGKVAVRDPRAFGTYLRESVMMLRRTREEVGRELPEVNRISQTVESDPKALERIAGSAAELAKLILSRNAEGYKGERMRAAEELSYLLRQATGISKAPYVAAFVKLLIENGENVLLAGWHREVYALWANLLREMKPVFFTGTESATQKEEAKRKFASGEAKVMCISLRAGAGLDGLQNACKTVVFGELDWSPGVHDQVIGRIHRDGQRNPVTAYYLLSETGSDPVVAEALGIKREQLEGVRNPTGDLIEKLTVGTDRIGRLAEHYLASRGMKPRVRIVRKLGSNGEG